MQERRQLPRWRIGKSAQVKLGIEENPRAGHIEDMHLKGMCVSLPEALSQDQPVAMSVAIGNYLEFEIEAKVTWLKVQGERCIHGVSFNKILDVDKEKIYGYISRYCSKQFKDRWWAT